MFEWCKNCKFVGTCYEYDEEDTEIIVRGPNYLEPACGEGPA